MQISCENALQGIPPPGVDVQRSLPEKQIHALSTGGAGLQFPVQTWIPPESAELVYWESIGRAAASSGPAAFPGVFSSYTPTPTPTPYVGSAHSVPLCVGAAIAFLREGNSSLISMDARFPHTAGAVLPCQSPSGGRPAARRADEPAADWPPAGGRGLPGGRAAAYSNRV